MEFIMLILLFILAINGCYGNEWEVDYHIPDHQQVIYDVPLKHGHDIHKRSPSQPLRIHLHFDRSVDRLPREHQALIKGKVHDAAAFWEDTLMVHPTSAPILLNRRCIRDTVRYYDDVRYCTDGCASETRCGDITVPSSHLRDCEWYDSVSNEYHSPRDTMPGVNTSFILYVAALSSDKCSWQKTVAFAAHCQQEQRLDRPIAGYFSICPKSVSTSIHKHEELLYTIKHEILHALGFTAGLYAFYRDKWGRPLTERDRFTGKPLVFDKNAGMYMWSDRVVKQYSRYAWKLKGQTMEKKVNMIITPNVVREVRQHFNCDTLEGGELEDQGAINGTAITHWEKRVFENEFMTGTYTQNPVISRISLALMEDTGWYSVKYGNAKTLEWGNNLGCDFATKSCYEWIETKLRRNEDIHPFCIEATRGQPVTDCSRNRKAVAICNLSEFNKVLPTQYQYFRTIPGVPSYEVGRFGGSVALADYCPYLQEFVWKQDSDFIRGSRCALVQNTLEPNQNYLLEKYNPTSKCFNHGSGWTLQTCRHVFTPHAGSGCYEYECRSDAGLIIYVIERGYRCYYAGQVLAIQYVDNQWLYRGNITCPSCTEMCQDQGIVCPPDDRSVYTIRQEPTYRVPCSEADNLSAKFCFTLFALFMSCFLTIYK